ncbi:hypothetical protein K2173_016393 [Erythroxylum novogranatense]|uniref:RING-type domain-containing protein n=1 Tax=Erythroxylum novogranatense TaxID=1862640 RepID=A0AAV8SG51_9ROSI|nr:hypothetical protein K2173_016393 [Erythroxylum novogranatense]
MNWNSQMELQYTSTNYPYNSAGSFIEYFEGLTYEHVNFIFNGVSHVQDSVYPSMNASSYKFGVSQLGSTSYEDHSHCYAVHDHIPQVHEHRRTMDSSSTLDNGQSAVVNSEWEEEESAIMHENPVECMRRHHNAHDYQDIWEDNVDPDNMSYEELLELGETVGTQNRGLSLELIALLPTSKYKCSFFLRRKSRSERCVICQMEYQRGDRRIALPCKHLYHVDCGTRWLSINKACPICYKEVFVDGSKR